MTSVEAPVTVSPAEVAVPVDPALRTPEQAAADAHAVLVDKVGQIDSTELKNLGMGDVAEKLGISLKEAHELGKSGLKKLEKEAQAAKAEKTEAELKQEKLAIDHEVAEHRTAVVKSQLKTLNDEIAERIQDAIKFSDNPTIRETMISGLKEEHSRRASKIESSADNLKATLLQGLDNGETKAVRDQKVLDQKTRAWQDHIGVHHTSGDTKGATIDDGVGYEGDATKGGMSYAEWLKAGGAKGASKRAAKAEDSTTTTPTATATTPSSTTPAGTPGATPASTTPAPTGGRPGAHGKPATTTPEGAFGTEWDAADSIAAVLAKKDEAATKTPLFLEELANAKAAKAAGDRAAYLSALGKMNAIAEGREVKKGEPTSEKLIDRIDSRLDAVETSKKLTPEEAKLLMEEERLNREKLDNFYKLNRELIDARNKFVKLTTKRQGTTIGSEDELVAIKKAYDTARNAAGVEVVTLLTEAGASAEDIKAFSKDGYAEEAKLLALKIKEAHEEAEYNKSWPIRKFNAWWARNTGVKENGKRSNKWGAFKKAAAITGMAAFPAAGLSVAAISALSVVGASVAGAMVGSGMVTGAARSIFRNKVDHAGNKVTGASVYADELVKRASGADLGDEITSKHLSDIVMKQTREIVTLNRKRMGKAALLGAAVGGATAGAGQLVHFGFDHFVGSHHSSGSAPRLANTHNTSTNPGGASTLDNVKPPKAEVLGRGKSFDSTTTANKSTPAPVQGNTLGNGKSLAEMNAKDLRTTASFTPNADPGVTDKVVFSLTEKWHTGSPTPWSWAESQGIPNKNVPAFLNEVMGKNWRVLSRKLPVGYPITATKAQIAKYAADKIGELPGTL